MVRGSWPAGGASVSRSRSDRSGAPRDRLKPMIGSPIRDVRFLTSFVLLLLTVPAGGGAAQDARKLPSAAARAVILPDKTIAGTWATLAVLDAAGRLVPKVVVVLGGEKKVTTDASGRAGFTTPAEPGVLTAKILGRESSAVSTIIAAVPASVGSPSGAAPVELAVYPPMISIHDRFTIGGIGFSGQADANQVSLSGQACLVLASSPVSLSVLPGPRTPTGDADLQVSVAGSATARNPVAAVLVEIEGPSNAVKEGEKGVLTIRVLGVREPLNIDVRNLSPRIIALERGNVQRVRTSGGERNTAPIEMKSLAPGDYSVTARLAPITADPAGLSKAE